jgi:hypothetical protein
LNHFYGGLSQSKLLSETTPAADAEALRFCPVDAKLDIRNFTGKARAREDEPASQV